jgi:ribonucleoside-diphosphate reductase alpha chain
MQITVTKRDGTRAPFNADRINKSIERACQGIEDWVGKVVQIASETRLMLYDGITTEELDHATINAALQNVQEDPAYDLIATRLLLKTIYKRVLGEYEDSKSMLAQKHAESFIPYISENVAGGLLDARMATNFNLEAIASALTISRDELFGYAGLSTTMDRYTLKNKEQKSLETPQYFFMRVAMGLSYNEPDPTAAAIRFYNRMSRLEYIAGGTTNIGAGTTRSALSNCFLMQIEDDMEHIAKSVADVMMLSKALPHSQRSSIPLFAQSSVEEKRKARFVSIWRTGTSISQTSLCGATTQVTTISACVLQTQPYSFQTNSCVA